MNQITRSPSYLIRNPHSYCFRMNVPKDLQSYVGKKELRWSLKTGYMSVAKQKARKMAAEVQTLFHSIRELALMSDLTDDEIKQIVNEHIQKLLKAVEYLRIERFPPETRQKLFSKFKGYHSRLGENSRCDLVEGDYSNAYFHVCRMITNGEKVYQYSNPTHRTLFRELLKGFVKYSEIEMRRWEGDYSDNIDEAFPVQTDDPKEASGTPSIDLNALVNMLNPQAEKVPSIKLSDLIDRYSDQSKRAGNWSEKTEIEYASIFRNILRLIGDVTLDSVTIESTRKIKEVLLNLPSDYFRATTKYKSIPAAQAARENEGKKLSVKTVNKYLDNIRALFRFAVQHGYMVRNYADGLKIPIKNKANTERLPFDDNDLIALFHSPGYKEDTFKTAWRFWIPILGLYTGCRLEELCQLTVADVQEFDSIWFIDIKGDQEADQRVKTETSVRKVPLHPFLTEDLRFPDFVKSLEPKGEIRLWKELKKYSGRWGHYPSRDFGTLKRKLGITDPKKVFHSFRHNFQNNLKQQVVATQIIDELVGHALQGETLGRYSQGFPVQTLYRKGVLKLNYKVDLSHLKASKWVPKD